MSLRSASVRVLPDIRSASLVLGVHRGDIERYRLLRRMLVLGAGIYIEMLHLPSLQRSARDHPLYRLFQHALGMFAFEPLTDGAPLDPTSIAGVIVEYRLLWLLAGHAQLGGVHHHDVVATIHVRRELRLVLTPEPVGDNGRKAAEYNALSVDQHPVLLRLRRLQRECALHPGGSVIWRRHMAGNTHSVKALWVLVLYYHTLRRTSRGCQVADEREVQQKSLTPSAGVYVPCVYDAYIS